MSTTLKVVLIVAGVLVLLGITCVGGLVGFGIWAGSQPPPEGITLDVALPDAISAGDEFAIVLTISNDRPEPRTLQDVDFWFGLLDGVTLRGADPAPNRVDTNLATTYSFNRTIPASGDLVVTFDADADTPGVYTGDLDISVDTIMSVLSTQQTITIYEASDTPSTDPSAEPSDGP